MNRKLDKSKEELFFEQHGGIVHGVLKKLTVPRTHPDYEDFVQQGLVKLVEAYEIFPNDPERPENRYPFGGFAYTRIRWHLLDLLRKQHKSTTKECSFPNHFADLIPEKTPPFEETIADMELLKEMLDLLSENERHYLTDFIIYGLSVTEIAKKNGVSRKTVYQWKKKTAQKLEHFSETLKIR